MALKKALVGGNCRGGLLAMPSVGGLGFEEVTRWWFSTAYKRNKATQKEILPSFRPSMEETLRGACLLVILMGITMGGLCDCCVYAVYSVFR